VVGKHACAARPDAAVINHLSWLDILAIHAAQHVRSSPSRISPLALDRMLSRRRLAYMSAERSRCGACGAYMSESLKGAT